MALSKIQDIGNQVVPNLGRRNLIINGGMRIAQRSTSAVASGNPGIHTIDRFHVWNGTDGAWTSERSTDAPEGFSNSFKAQVTSADTSLAAGQYAQFEQRIEAQNLQHLNYGSSTAKTLTLSFHCKSNKTGTYGIAVYKEDDAGSLSTMLFPVDFSISSADTWEKKTITIVTDSTIRGAAGGITDDNGSGLRIFWNLASGSTFRTGTNSTWSTNTNHFATSNQITNWMDSTSNNFYITGVQLEVGDTATDFEHRSHGEELALCHRYYNRLGLFYGRVRLENVSSQNPDFVTTITFPPMRDAPTINTYTDANYSSSGTTTTGGSVLSFLNISKSSANASMNSASSGAQNVSNSAYLELDKEL